MKHGSLFSGIGGFDLAAEWMGWENVFHCEWNEFGKRILNYYWPKSISYHDITQTDFTIHRGQIDILTGGFPCQPFSAAGKRKGTDDDRHLWPEMRRAIREIAPRYIVGENVYGLVNWDGGMVFEQVQADLEAEGYEVTPIILPACAVNAPHRRDRIWFVAYSNGCRSDRTKEHENGDKDCGNRQQSDNANNDGKIRRTTTDSRLLGQKVSKEQTAGIEQRDKGDATDTGRIGLEGGLQTGINDKQRRDFQQRGKVGQHLFENRSGIQFENFPTQSPICSRDDEFSARLDGITFPKWRNESIKAYGNAVVPELVVQIFKAIEQHELVKEMLKDN